jgi:large subunit ribosomal protein L21
MHAIVRVCGKQYRVAENDTLIVSRLEGDAGATVTLDEVLSIGDGDAATFGVPVIKGASVSASIVAQGKGPKIDGFTYKAKKNVRNHYGHRQDITTLKIGAITSGKK